MDPIDPLNEVGNVLNFGQYVLEMIWESNGRSIENPKSTQNHCASHGKIRQNIPNM